MSEYRFKITYRNENEYGQYWGDKRHTVLIIAETLEQAKEKLDNIEKNDWKMHKNILNWEAEEIINNEQLKSQLQQKENVIKEAREYIEKHRHKPSENLIQTCENFIKEQEYLLTILDKENK